MIRRTTGVILRAGTAIAAASLCIAVLAALLAPGYRAPSVHPLSARAWDGTRPGRHAVEERAAVIPDADGTIAARLYTPAEPTAALVLVHGSGSGSSRRSAVVARRLAGVGIAVLVAPKDTRDYSWRHRDYAAIGDRAVSHALWLRGELGLPAEAVGLLGISEGGWASLLAVAEHPELVGPLVLDSCPVVTPLEESAHVLTARGPLAVSLATRAVTGQLAAGRPIIDYLDVDVRASLPNIENRVVAVFGAHDRAVPVSQAVGRLREGLPQEPDVLLARGGHGPDPEGWVDAVAATLAEQPPAPGAPARTVAVQVPDSALRGAPRPPDPSWLLDPRWHLALAVPLGLALTRIRRRRSPVITPTPGGAP